jgi:hypothetical protein
MMTKRLLALALVGLLGACGGGDDPEPADPSAQESSAETPAAEPPSAEETALQEAASIAYQGAADYAVTNDNYFARNQAERGELAAAVSVALSDANSGVASVYAKNVDQLGWCSQYPGVLLARVWSSSDGRSLRIAVADGDVALELTYDAGDPEPAYSEPEDCIEP